ncbi:MAG: type II toxin-antitoxin system VapB family antitoxin [Desulfobacteraceae bacterium]|nr:type II toxin-antitoxin system VapB family antitoxin [Desulfobacteraceae bacterium]
MARTVIDIDEEMLARAQQLTGLRKKVEVVNFAVKKLVEQKEIEKILDLRGKVAWEGDLDEMRKDRHGCH